MGKAEGVRPFKGKTFLIALLLMAPAVGDGFAFEPLSVFGEGLPAGTAWAKAGTVQRFLFEEPSCLGGNVYLNQCRLVDGSIQCFP